MKNSFRAITVSRSAALASIVLLSACATNRQYDTVVQEAKYTQTKLHEAERRLTQLEQENLRLKTQLKSNEVAALSEAGFGDEWQTRLSELQAKIDGLNRPLQDVERFEVEGGYVLMVQDKILFDSGSSDLNAEGKKQIAALAAEINARPHGNLQLSAARAVEVGAQLIQSDKISSRDVAVVGFGPHDPLKPNNSADNKRLNRRVEIFVSDASGSGREVPKAPAK